jgi:hydroxypyruvate reductase
VLHNRVFERLGVGSTEEIILDSVVLNQLARTIFGQALADCSIERAFEQKMKVVTAVDGRKKLLFGENVVDLAHVKHVRIVAIGKASRTMLEALLPLPAHCDLAGVLIAPAPPKELPPEFEFFAGGHPVPDEASFAGARAVLSMLQELPESVSGAKETLCLFLISGGASAMMELPLDPVISLTDTIAFHRALVHSGASIAEMNCVRKHFSAVKGGRLALVARGAECLSVLVSDVPSGHLDTIASGPTVPDTSTIYNCREILTRYNLIERFPASVRRFFASPDLPETPKPDTLTARTLTLLDASDLAEAARQRAEQLGFHVVIDNTCDDWDYRAASEYLLARLRMLRREHTRICLISVGEVAVSSASDGIGAGDDLMNSGIGGRNQHFALYTATLLESADGPIAVLSAGSDGIDGNSAAAGAVVNEQTLSSAKPGVSAPDNIPMDEWLGTEAQMALQQFRSFAFLESSGATITTGPTGNNLRDLRILLAEQPPSAAHVS